MIYELVSLFERFILYSVMYTVSLYLINQANRAKNRATFIAFSFFALLLPCLFAAYRGETVGTDVLQYAKPYYLGALNSGTLQSYLLQGSAETGYEVFVFFVTKLFGNFNAVLFFTEALIIVPVYCVAIKNRKSCPMWVTMFVYYMVFYIASFNFMRQSVAAAFLLLAYFELIEKKWISFVLLVCVAQLFHNTAFIGVAVIIFGVCFYRLKSKQLRFLAFTALCIILILISINWETLITWAIYDLKILPRRFVNYVNIFTGGQNQSSYYFLLTKSNYIELIFRWLLYIGPIICCSKKITDTSLYKSANIILLLSVVVYTALFVLFHTSYAVRITWYMEYFFLVWLPICYSRIKIKKEHVGIISRSSGVMFLLAFSYWFCGYMILGWHGTLPFVFSF